MGKKNFVLIAIIILLLLIIVSGIILYMFVLNKPEEPQVKEITIDKNLVMYPFDSSFVNNVKESTRMAKLTVQLEVDTKLVELLDYKKSAIIEKINLIMRGKTIQDLAGKEGQLKLEAEIHDMIVKMISTEKYVDVNIEEFIVQ